MTSIGEYAGQISEQLDELQKLIDKIEKSEGQQRANRIKNCQLKIKNIKNDLETYEFEISNLDRHEEAQYRKNFDTLSGRYKLAKNDFELKRNEGNQAAEQLFADRAQKFKVELQDRDVKAMDQDQMIQFGQEVQEKGIEKLNAMEGLLEEDLELADRINQELDEQIKKLDGISATTMDIQTQLKRTTKLITYFAKTVSTDKILMCLICTITLIIVILIILSIAGVGTGFNVKDIV